MLIELPVLELLVLTKLLAFSELSDVAFLHLLVLLVLLREYVPVLMLWLGFVLVELVIKRLVEFKLALILMKPEFFLLLVPAVLLLGSWLAVLQLISLLDLIVLLHQVM